MPTFGGLKALFWGSDGLVRMAPALLLVPLGYLLMIVRGEARDALVCALIAAFALLFGGHDPGALAFALVFSAWAFARIIEALGSVAGGPVVVGVLSVWTVAIAALSLSTYPYIPADYGNGLRDLVLVLFRDGVFMANVGHRLGLSGGFSVLPLAVALGAIGLALALGGVPRSEGGSWQRVVAVWLLGLSALWWQISWAPDGADPRKRYREALSIERAMLAASKTDTRLQLRAQRIELTAGKDSRDARLARGQAATAEGDNAKALDSYRAPYRRTPR
jgi:hypothetical protein